MKRSPLRRLTSLRRTGRLRPVGAKVRREQVAVAAARAVLLDRSDGQCEAPGAAGGLSFGQLRIVCGTTKTPHAGVDAHHVWPEDRDRGVHDPVRMLWLCRHAHDWAHGHPKGAARLGLLRPTVVDDPGSIGA